MMITREMQPLQRVATVRFAAAVLISGAALSPSPPAWSQDGGAVTVDVEHCVALTSATERRDCFAAQVDAALEQSEVSAQPPAQRRVPANTASAGASPNPAPSRSDTSESDEYFGTIVAMRERLPSSYVIQLDNGQIWEQTEPKRYPLRPGLEVRVYPTRWGSRYRLTGVDTGGHIQVRRVQ